MRRYWVVWACGLAAWAAGCTENTGSPAPQAQMQRVIDADADEVLQDAQGILQREFGRVTVDRSTRRITTAPVEFTATRDTGTARDLVGGRTRMRRLATFEVGRRGEVTVARLRVDVEREDTQQRTVIQPQGYRLSDTPGSESAVDRDAATTAQQNTVWTRIRRDAALERAILDELRERFSRRTVEVSSPNADGAPEPSTSPAASPRP